MALQRQTYIALRSAMVSGIISWLPWETFLNLKVEYLTVCVGTIKLVGKMLGFILCLKVIMGLFVRLESLFYGVLYP